MRMEQAPVCRVCAGLEQERWVEEVGFILSDTSIVEGQKALLRALNRVKVANENKFVRIKIYVRNEDKK